MKFYLHEDLKKYFSKTKPLFDQIMKLRGECFRQQDGRITQRIMLGEKNYFIKQHVGVGVKEIIKNLLQWRKPVISAKNEWTAIQKLQSLKLPTPVVLGYGQRGFNPARMQSFVLMEELAPVISLEDLCKTWEKKPPNIAFKHQLIQETARMAAILHHNGINHRDFYICHFLLDTSHGDANIDPEYLKLYLIDLHRAQIRRLTPRRWIIKDLSGLYFSSKDIGLTRRDLYRFMKIYHGKPLREIFALQKDLWEQVKKRGEQLYRDHS